MKKEFSYDYDSELDILHVYSSEIKEGIKGCLSIGDFNIDIGGDNKIVGVEIEEASKILRLPSEILSSLDTYSLLVRKTGNSLLIGLVVAKEKTNSAIQVTIPSNKIALQVTH